MSSGEVDLPGGILLYRDQFEPDACLRPVMSIRRSDIVFDQEILGELLVSALADVFDLVAELFVKLGSLEGVGRKAYVFHAFAAVFFFDAFHQHGADPSASALFGYDQLSYVDRIVV